ncbi:retrotransposon protein, putative, ty3-gypsy subclass [Tanacetum coccineum]
MTTLADKSLLSGGDNKPPMLEKHLYDLWKSRMELYMMNRPHGRMILASVEKGPLVWPSITEDGVTRLKDLKLTPAEINSSKICDISNKNIILQGLPTEIYALVSQHRLAKDLWEKIKLLMQGTSLTKQEHECKLYDEFDKFTYKKGEMLHEYYLRFTLLLNDMNIYKMPLEQFQVNTKFLNTLPDEWSKFVTDVKLVKDLHTTNILIPIILGVWKIHITDGESLESYYSRFYKMMNELVRNQCHVTNHKVNGPVHTFNTTDGKVCTLVKQSQELKIVSYHKLYDILKQHQNEVNEIRTERLAQTQTVSTRNRGKAIVTSSAPTYDPEPATVTEDEEMSKEKEIDKLMALISLSRKEQELEAPLYVHGHNFKRFTPDSLHFWTNSVSDDEPSISFAKPEFLKKAQRANPRLYDIGCYNDNLALMLAPDSDETIRLDKERRSKLSDLIRPFDYAQLNIFMTWFDPQRGKRKTLEKCERLEKALSKSKITMSKNFGILRNMDHSLRATSSESRVMSNNSQGKKQEVEDHRRKFKFSNNKTSVTACNDSLNAKTSNVNFVCVTCGKCVLNDNHDLCVLHYINGVNSRTRQPMAVPVRTTEPKHDVNKSVATSVRKPLKQTSTVKKSRKNKLGSYMSKFCKAWAVGGILSIHHLDTNGNLSLKKEMLIQTLVGAPLCPILHCLLILLQLVEIVLFIVGVLKAYAGKSQSLYKFCGEISGHGDVGIESNRKFLAMEIWEMFFSQVLVGRFVFISLQDSTSPNSKFALWLKATLVSSLFMIVVLSHLNFDTLNLLSKKYYVEWPSKVNYQDHLCSSVSWGKQKEMQQHVLSNRSLCILDMRKHLIISFNGPMASDHVSSDPAPQCTTMVLEQDSLSPDPQSQENVPHVAETEPGETSSRHVELRPSTSLRKMARGVCSHYRESKTEPKKQQRSHGFFCMEEINAGELHQFDRLGYKGYAQKEELISKESFAPVARGDKLVSWSSKKQDCTLMSSAEAEYVSLSACCAQVLWLRTQLTDYGFHFDKIPMYCDSKAAIAISCNQVQAFPYQAHQMFKSLVRQLGMRCLTPDELEGRMPTKIDLTLEQSQQGVSNDVLSSANKKPEYVKSEEKKEDKKVDEKKRDMSKVKCYNCKKEGHFAKDCKKAKVKDYNYYKTKMLLAKKDSDEQVLLAEDQAWMESSSDSDQEINANMVFMAKMENVLSDSEESSSSAEETIAEVSYYTSDFESESEYETSEYYDNSTNYGLFVNNDDDQEIFHDAIESASENFNENHIVSQTDHDQSEVDHNDSEDKDHLVDKLIKKFNHKIAKCQKRIEKANQQSKDLENQNKDLQDKYDVLKNQVNTFEEKNNEFNEQIKVLNETNVDLLAQMEVLQEQLKVKHVVIDTHCWKHEKCRSLPSCNSLSS